MSQFRSCTEAPSFRDVLLTCEGRSVMRRPSPTLRRRVPRFPRRGRRPSVSPSPARKSRPHLPVPFALPGACSVSIAVPAVRNLLGGACQASPVPELRPRPRSEARSGVTCAVSDRLRRSPKVLGGRLTCSTCRAPSTPPPTSDKSERVWGRATDIQHCWRCN